MSGSSGALYQPTTTTSSSTAYTTASGTIALDVTSVTPACQAVSFFQCVKSYSVALSGSGFTLVSTSGTADACGTGIGKRLLCAKAVTKTQTTSPCAAADHNLNCTKALADASRLPAVNLDDKILLATVTECLHCTCFTSYLADFTALLRAILGMHLYTMLQHNKWRTSTLFTVVTCLDTSLSPTCMLGSCAATLQDNGAGATGYFTDGTLFTAANKGSYILVNVDNGTCIGAYSVSHYHACSKLQPKSNSQR